MIKRDELADPRSCLNKADDDEPLFVLRGSDPAAADIVRAWATLSSHAGYHRQEKIEQAFEVAQALDKWPKNDPN